MFRMAFDAGSRALKCAIADESNKIVAMEKIYPIVQVTKDGFGRSYSPSTFWEDLLKLTKKTIRTAKVDPKNIRYISTCGIRPSCVFTDEDNNALFIASSFDGRGIDVAEEIDMEFEEQSGKSFYQSSGHFPSLLFPPAKYGWIRQNPDCIKEEKQITRYFPTDSWILVQFGGEPHVNIVSAAESGFFDLDLRYWHEAWNDVLDVSEDFFPPPVASGEIIGNVSEKIQSQLGFSSETELVAGLPDTQAALLGSGGIHEGVIGVVLGSTAPVQAITKNLIIDSQQRTWSSLYVIKNLCNSYILEPNTGMTGQILTWAANLYSPSDNLDMEEKYSYIQKQYEQWDFHERSLSLDEVNEKTVYASLGPSPLAPTKTELGPGIFYFPTPGGVEEVINTPDAFISAVYDNILFAVTKNIEYARQIADIKHPIYSITGGASRSNVLCQRFADLMGSPFYHLEFPEASIQGLFILCEIAANTISTRNEIDKYFESSLCALSPRADMKEKLEIKYRTWDRIRLLK